MVLTLKAWVFLGFELNALGTQWGLFTLVFQYLPSLQVLWYFHLALSPIAGSLCYLTSHFLYWPRTCSKSSCSLLTSAYSQSYFSFGHLPCKLQLFWQHHILISASSAHWDFSLTFNVISNSLSKGRKRTPAKS